MKSVWRVETNCVLKAFNNRIEKRQNVSQVVKVSMEQGRELLGGERC